MAHSEFTRKGADARISVLFIHGIGGTPNHFKAFVPLVPERFSVCNMLLDGHGGTVRDFSRASMEKWKAQVEKKITELTSRGERLIITAHSMGTLFAIRHAVKSPELIEGLFLLAPPLKLALKPAMAVNSLKLCFGAAENASDIYGTEPDRRLWRYLGWAPRYLELLSEIKKTRELAAELNVPCRVFLSAKDEMVSPRSAEMFSQSVKPVLLESSSHYRYGDTDLARLTAEFSAMLAGF